MLLDASALLALLNDELGANDVRKVMTDAKVSAVNIAEVVGKLADYKVPDSQIRKMMAIGFDTLPFGVDEIAHMAKVRSSTKKLGLSLGDRCCLATALVHKEPVLTADRAWMDIRIRGVKVQCIR